ncbi:MAG TPA: hypothetical protein DSN98_04240 [Thermoplasmata archaeon]|jgi:hypothetical protein|nr:MAG TPA: hypothetical protein DSN98_04240 [Thermoplasmata archaeon]
MKTIIKISILASLLCIGFIPSSTGAGFEPAKTAVYLGDNNPGNYSLLQYALQHHSNQNTDSGSYGTDYHSRVIIDRYSPLQNYDTLVVSNLMRDGHSYLVPFNLIGLFFSNQQPVDTNLY